MQSARSAPGPLATCRGVIVRHERPDAIPVCKICVRARWVQRVGWFEALPSSTSSGYGHGYQCCRDSRPAESHGGAVRIETAISSLTYGNEFPPISQDDQRSDNECAIRASLETVSHLILQTKWLPV